MISIFVKPENKSIQGEAGQKLMTALKQAGFEINSSCGGKAVCTDCRVKVLEGEENLSPMEFKEQQLLGNVFHMTKERLSCQAELQGECVVDISEHKNKPKTKRRKPEDKKQKDESREPKPTPEGGKKRPKYETFIKKK